MSASIDNIDTADVSGTIEGEASLLAADLSFIEVIFEVIAIDYLLYCDLISIAYYSLNVTFFYDLSYSIAQSPNVTHR